MLPSTYYAICVLLSLTILYGIFLMSKVKTAVYGNLLSCLATALAIILTIKYHELFSELFVLYLVLIGIGIGSVIGLLLAKKVKMIQMPELVASLNGVGGAASAIVGGSALFSSVTNFELITSVLALIIGTLTLTGSLIAAGKLSKLIDGRPVIWNGQQMQINLLIAVLVVTVLATITAAPSMIIVLVIATLFSGILGFAFTLRVGGADMPITISLLNSLSGVAGSIAGMAIGDILLVAVGGIVGASGLLLTQIMCRSMNSSLSKILLGKTSIATAKKQVTETSNSKTVNPIIETAEIKDEDVELKLSNSMILHSAKKVIIVPGYGMALAQAQHLVKQLSDHLEANGTEVKYAIHPVAGRMPGHMNVLLCEADVPYEKLYELDVINEEFRECDACIVIGANDVMNPAAREAEGTPIYGMPVLNVDKAKHIIICNYDLKPGYAGVENPLYKRKSGVSLLLGDAGETLNNLLNELKMEKAKESLAGQITNNETNAGSIESLNEVKKVIIVPGYGMALAQAQHLVKQLSDQLERNGAEVKYAIHPVAGRMPGHMNVLLCEADVPYEKLYELDVINEEFSKCDACIVIGANDVINPAAREAEGTPIYGMPVLNVDKAKHIIICNYDLKPGYAGVENPLYKRNSGVSLLLGDASESLQKIINNLEIRKVNKVKEVKGVEKGKQLKTVNF